MTSSDPIDAAEIELSYSPDPVNAQVSTNAEYQWMASFAVTLSETAGIGGDIESLSTALYESAGGIILNAVESEEHRFSTNAETSRVEGNGSGSVDFDAFYTLPGAGREALVTVTLTFVDDNGYQTGDTIEVSIK
jgi:hypothetical protein